MAWTKGYLRALRRKRMPSPQRPKATPRMCAESHTELLVISRAFAILQAALARQTSVRLSREALPTLNDPSNHLRAKTLLSVTLILHGRHVRSAPSRTQLLVGPQSPDCAAIHLGLPSTLPPGVRVSKSGLHCSRVVLDLGAQVDWSQQIRMGSDGSPSRSRSRA